MKLFVRQGYRLSSLPLPAKLIYSFFLAFIAIGIWSSWDLYRDRVQPDVEARYVTESAEPALVGPAEPADGPSLELDLEDEVAADLPGDTAEPEDLKGPWVLDVFHQHLFSISVVFLILAHLFMLVPLHSAVRTTVIVLAGGSSLAHVLAPVIIWKTGGSAWLMPASGAVMGVSWSLIVGITFIAMWFGGRKPPEAA